MHWTYDDVQHLPAHVYVELVRWLNELEQTQ